MPLTVIDIDTATPRLGVSFRSPRPGPELDLLEWFLEQAPFRIPRKCRATVFREPRLDSGFPDIVLVIWSIARTQQWTSARSHVTTRDLRLMHYLHESGPCTDDKLNHVFPRNTFAALERLEAAEMTRRAGNCWHPRPLSKAFAATQIIAIEAKVGEWESVLHQALLNTWFASHSYVLVPRLPKNSELITAATTLGIGICTKEQPKLHTGAAPAPRGLPRSYASWLFNDWAWRAAHY